MATPLTKADLERAFGKLATKDAIGRLDTKLDGVESRLSGSIRGLNENFNKGQSAQNERLARLETKMDAILDEVSTRRELHNLVRELKGRGIQLDEAKIFLAAAPRT